MLKALLLQQKIMKLHLLKHMKQLKWKIPIHKHNKLFNKFYLNKKCYKRWQRMRKLYLNKMCKIQWHRFGMLLILYNQMCKMLKNKKFQIKRLYRSNKMRLINSNKWLKIWNKRKVNQGVLICTRSYNLKVIIIIKQNQFRNKKMKRF